MIVCITTQVTAEEESQLVELQSNIRHEDESVQWLPHSVTVLTGEQLEATYRRDLEEIESIVPGLIIDRMNTTPRGAAIALRGLGSSGASKDFDPAVAVNIDGIYVGTHTGRLLTLFDVEKIEVVRGPHLFEANPNIAGSINLERTRPTGELDLKLRASMGIDERREIDAVFNAPIVDSLNAKISVYHKDQGGDYMTNVYSGRDENTEDYYIISTTLGWDLPDLFSLTYTFDTESSDETTPALLNISGPTDLLCASTATTQFPNCRRGKSNPELDSLVLTSQNFSNDRNYEGDHHTLKIEFEAFGHQFISTTGHRKTDERMDFDLDASNSDFYHLQQRQDYEQFSQEFVVLGQFNERLSYSGGFYYLDSEYDIFQQEHEILKQLSAAGFTEGHAAGEIQELTSQQESTLWSVFTHARYVINDQWAADMGVRWTEVDRDFRHEPSRIRLDDNLSPLRTLLVGEETSKELLLEGGLSYKVDEEAMIYLRYSEGFLPGGFDENAMSVTSGNSYGSETATMIEIGLKSDWWEDKLRVNLVFYKSRLDDKVERFDSVVASGEIESLLDNVSEVKVSGWELEVESIPLDNLYIKASYGHADANYRNYTVPDLANTGASLNLSSSSPSRAPSNNLYFSAQYDIPYRSGVFHTYAGYRLFSDYQTNPLIPEAQVNNWTSVDLSISYEWKEWVFRLFSNNVKNKEFIPNVGRITQTAILPVDAGSRNVPSLITYTEYNQPRYTGLEIVYTPEF